MLCCLTVYACAETTTAGYIGTINGDVYENPVFGIGCSLPGWKYASEAEIQALLNQITGSAPDDVSEVINSSNNVTLMYANDSSGLQTVTLQVQKMNMGEITLANTFDAETVVKTILEAATDTLVSSYESLGCSNVQVVINSVNIDGTDFIGLKVTASMNGIPIYSQEIAYISGDYMVYVAVNTFISDGTADIFSNFYVIQ